MTDAQTAPVKYAWVNGVWLCEPPSDHRSGSDRSGAAAVSLRHEASAQDPGEGHDRKPRDVGSSGRVLRQPQQPHYFAAWMARYRFTQSRTTAIVACSPAISPTTDAERMRASSGP